MVYFNVLGLHFLVLSSQKRTTDLFGKRSSNYSDRMQMPMLMDLYVSDSSDLNELVDKRSLQNEVGFQLCPYAVWRVLAKTQEIIS